MGSAIAASALSEPTLPRHTPLRDARPSFFSIHFILILFCVYAVGSRLLTVVISGGWADRSQFFVDGELRPTMVDFIFNELMIYYLLIRVIIYRFNLPICLLIVASGFSYYTRVPITLLFFAIAVSTKLDLRWKIWTGLAVIVASFSLLYLRIGDDLIYSENSSIFYLIYPMIGLARLWQTTQSIDVNAWHYATLAFKPLDAVMFLVDYFGVHGGQLSAARFSGMELSQFEYIQSLQGSYNAFGSILYPFVYIAGWVSGILIFIVFLIGQRIAYMFATQSSDISNRYLIFLLITGILFSWPSPFVWLAPFIFTRIRNRRRGRAS